MNEFNEILTKIINDINNNIEKASVNLISEHDQIRCEIYINNKYWNWFVIETNCRITLGIDNSDFVEVSPEALVKYVKLISRKAKA